MKEVFQGLGIWLIIFLGLAIPLIFLWEIHIKEKIVCKPCKEVTEKPRCVKLECLKTEIVMDGQCVKLENNWQKLQKRMDEKEDYF